MGTRYELQSREFVIATAESLKSLSGRLMQVAIDMQLHGMSDAFFPWSKRQSECLQIIEKFVQQCPTVLPTQIVAKVQNRPSSFDILKKKSARDAASRKIRNTGLPSKPRGRPRKVLA